MFREFSAFMREIEKHLDPSLSAQVARRLATEAEAAQERALVRKGYFISTDEMDDLESTLERAQDDSNETLDYALELVRRIRDGHA